MDSVGVRFLFSVVGADSNVGCLLSWGHVARVDQVAGVGASATVFGVWGSETLEEASPFNAES